MKIINSKLDTDTVAVAKILVLFFFICFSSFNLSGQAVMRADTERVSNVGPMKGSLVSSSDLRSYRFYNPFVIQNVNPAGDQFGYDETTNTLSFFIQRMGETHSREKRLYLIINRQVDFVKATRITPGYDETYLVREFERISAPNHSIFNVLPSATAGIQTQSIGYNLGVSDWSNGVGIEVKFRNGIDQDFVMGIMVVNPNQFRRLTEEIIQHFAAPARFLGRILGESNYSNYISFANFHFEYSASQGLACNNLLLTSSTYSETSNLNASVSSELGSGHSIADWNDLKSIRNIDAWISCMGLQNGESFMIAVNGNPRYRNSNRQYFVRYAPGGVPGNFLVHDKIGDKLFLGSWHGLNLKILGKKR